MAEELVEGLKPCPLCGNIPEVKRVEHCEKVYCPECGASTL